MMSLTRAINIASCYEPRRLGLRLYHELARHTGWYRHRFSRKDLNLWRPSAAGTLFAATRTRGKTLFGVQGGERGVAQKEYEVFQKAAEEMAQRVVEGQCLYFSHRWHDFGGLPDWRANPLTGGFVTSEKHWSDLDFYSPEYGDLKIILEPSRFTSSFLLGRTYLLTKSDTFAETFWSQIEDWADKNPPSDGPLWICGQECALRVIAWFFGLLAVAGSVATTADRVGLLYALIASHVERIQGTLPYSRSQKNNHGVSEAVALFAAGVLYPEHSSAKQWRSIGDALLDDEVRAQVYEDGAYVQQSLNYHRLFLQLLLWRIRLGELFGCPASGIVTEAFSRAWHYLYSFLDPLSGRVPNAGSNDGALLLPLNSCDYLDYRPVLQAGHYLLYGTRLLPEGPWDEDLLWLFGPEALGKEKAENVGAQTNPFNSTVSRSETLPGGGYYFLRGDKSWGVIRCAKFRDRPAHADQLHLDLWFKGYNIATDAGTYTYNSDAPWDNALARTHVHNTVCVDGTDQMTRGGKFLWLDWAQGEVEVFENSPDGRLSYWEGSHSGYRQRGVVHRRAVLRFGEEGWVVVDDLLGQGTHNGTVHWLLPDDRFEMEVKEATLRAFTPVGPIQWCFWCSDPARLGIVRAGEVPKEWRGPGHYVPKRGIENLGWVSRYYSTKEPAVSCLHNCEGELPLRFVTVILLAPGRFQVLDGRRITIQTRDTLGECVLHEPGNKQVLETARYEGADGTDQLVLAKTVT